ATARKVAVEVEHPRAGTIKLVSPPISYNGKKMQVRRPPPWLGEHTEEVLYELGYSKEEVKGLRDIGAV
ncbi:hypothetical protein MPER_15745, partial [Moniliophthora perniciosa FA553]